MGTHNILWKSPKAALWIHPRYGTYSLPVSNIYSQVNGPWSIKNFFLIQIRPLPHRLHSCITLSTYSSSINSSCSCADDWFWSCPPGGTSCSLPARLLTLTICRPGIPSDGPISAERCDMMY